MSHLRHRASTGYQTLRKQFTTPALILSIAALILALAGGAYAAGGGLSGKQKKEVEKIAKEYAGKPGVPGAAGTNGTNGTNGKDGTDGKDGAPGKDGVNVTFSPASEAACPSGGSVFKAANGETTICNGETGFTETLPAGKTETGVWAGTFFEVGPVPISFDIPLAAPIGGADTKVVPEGGTPPAECQNPEHAGAASVENPEAQPGFLCIYVHAIYEGAVAEVTTAADAAGAGTTGTVVVLESTFTEPSKGRGSWAVTAPTSP
jgi:hypothetical protein